MVWEHSEGPETPMEWTSESVTDQPTARDADGLSKKSLLDSAVSRLQSLPW